MKQLKIQKGITLVALIITVIIMLVLAGVVIAMTIGEKGIFSNTKYATDEHIKQEAKETMNLKISGIQMQSYTETQNLPSLQYLADRLCEDEEMEYVIKKEKKVASLEKIDVTGVDSIFTKIKKYPYEFEIDSKLRLASIDGVEIADNEQTITISREEYEALKPKSISADSLLVTFKSEHRTANTYQLNQFEKTEGSQLETYFSISEDGNTLTCQKSGWFSMELDQWTYVHGAGGFYVKFSCLLNDVEVLKADTQPCYETSPCSQNNSTLFLEKGDTVSFKRELEGNIYSGQASIKIFKL